MIKAVRGGGGKGMRIAREPGDFDEQLAAARRESLKAFNNDDMLIEKYVERPRHVEVQIFGDHHGHYVYLWERDCSIQRRHQKILEEAPAPGLKPSVRKSIGEAAVAAARAVNYVGAGTVEFVMDSDQNFYFMEMNTRLQVEHPITEAITGTDLVDWQLRVASGQPLPITDQSNIPLLGHAFEARLYAEDCSDPEQMMPTAGHLGFVRPPPDAVSYCNSSTGVRVDTGVRSGDDISVHYDPMIAKLVVTGQTREEALDRLGRALAAYHVAGLPTNVAFLRKLIAHPGVVAGEVHTGFITQHVHALRPQPPPEKYADHLDCVSALWALLEPRLFPCSQQPPGLLHNNLPGFRINLPPTRTLTLLDNFGQSYSFRVTYPHHCDQFFLVEHLSEAQQVIRSTRVRAVKIKDSASNAGWPNLEISVELNAVDGAPRFSNLTVVGDRDSHRLYIFDHSNGIHAFFNLPTPSYVKELQSTLSDDAQSSADPASNVSPMPGVIERILVKVGEEVESGQALLTLIAMKMEYTVRARVAGCVESVEVNPNETVAGGQLLVRIKARRV